MSNCTIDFQNLYLTYIHNNSIVKVKLEHFEGQGIFYNNLTTTITDFQNLESLWPNITQIQKKFDLALIDLPIKYPTYH